MERKREGWGGNLGDISLRLRVLEELQMGSFSSVNLKNNLHFSRLIEAGDCSRVTAGPIDLI